MDGTQIPAPDPQVDPEIRKKFRIISFFSLLLLLALIGAISIHLVAPPLSYVLFCLVFVFEFGATAYIIWSKRVFWWSKERYVLGNRARAIALVYFLLVFAFLTFAIFFIVR